MDPADREFRGDKWGDGMAQAAEQADAHARAYMHWHGMAHVLGESAALYAAVSTAEMVLGAFTHVVASWAAGKSVEETQGGIHPSIVRAALYGAMQQVFWAAAERRRFPSPQPFGPDVDLADIPTLVTTEERTALPPATEETDE